ncbi:MAG: hypothetical protein Q8M98_07125, partial [Candidatus Cloacimonadaceae bacterium]|nr:hypothetical protein [Candidatus Cloacimonadaceae bacterium]
MPMLRKRNIKPILSHSLSHSLSQNKANFRANIGAKIKQVVANSTQNPAKNRRSKIGENDLRNRLLPTYRS